MLSTRRRSIAAKQKVYRRRLGITLQEVRQRLTQYSQGTIAEELGVATETVGRWERGSREPTAYMLSVMADRYQLPPEIAAWFLNPSDSISELEERIERIRQLQLERAAAEAARDAVEEEAQRGVVRGAAKRGTR